MASQLGTHQYTSMRRAYDSNDAIITSASLFHRRWWRADCMPNTSRTSCAFKYLRNDKRRVCAAAMTRTNDARYLHVVVCVAVHVDKTVVLCIWRKNDIYACKRQMNAQYNTLAKTKGKTRQMNVEFEENWRLIIARKHSKQLHDLRYYHSKSKLLSKCTEEYRPWCTASRRRLAMLHKSYKVKATHHSVYVFLYTDRS